MQLMVEPVFHTPRKRSPHVHVQISCRKWLPRSADLRSGFPQNQDRMVAGLD